jgi:hypothetical protein
MGEVKDENQTPPAGIFYPAFFASTRIGSANVATAGTKMSAAPNQDRSANGVRQSGVRRNAAAPPAFARLETQGRG